MLFPAGSRFVAESGCDAVHGGYARLRKSKSKRMREDSKVSMAASSGCELVAFCDAAFGVGTHATTTRKPVASHVVGRRAVANGLVTQLASNMHLAVPRRARQAPFSDGQHSSKQQPTPSTNTNTPFPRLLHPNWLDSTRTTRKPQSSVTAPICSVRGPRCPSDPPALPSQSTEDMLDSVNLR
ncbi:hypothetical protein HDV57DRAFT_196120 [Trichoderma longibrachiatum]